MDDNNQNFREQLKATLKKEERSVTGFFIKNFRLTYLLLIAIVALGLFSLFSLPREANPEVKLPFAVVNTLYPGASPTDVEELVTNELEEEIDGLEKLNRYTSTSRENLSTIFVEFEAEADLAESYRKLRQAVDNARPALPDEAEDPEVVEIRANDFPIITFSLIGDFTDAELKDFAESLQSEFEAIAGVSRAPIIGGIERQYQVILDKTALARYNLSLGQVIGAISRNNMDFPVGDVEINDYRYNVRVKARTLTTAGLERLPVATFESTTVYLEDLAVIKDTFAEQSTDSRIGFAGEEAHNTISLQIYKKTGGNILEIVDAAGARVDELKADRDWPQGLEVISTNDNSVFIRDDLSRLGTSAIQTFLLIFIILFLVLSWRGAVVTAISVPIAFLISFIFLYIQGMTLNSMVLFSLVLSLGLMVDNSIVIIEGINEYLTRFGRNVKKAALYSSWHFKYPITAGTLTTVSAFLPMLLVSGIMGEYMSILPKTLTVTLLASLFVAIVVIPTLAARAIKLKAEEGGARDKKRHQAIEKVRGRLVNNYRRIMKELLPFKAKRRTLIAGAWLAFILAVAVPAAGFMRIEMFPKVDFDYFYIDITLPAGSSLNLTDEVARDVENAVRTIPELDNYVTVIGQGAAGQDFTMSGTSARHRASVTVNLVDDTERERTSFEVADELRAEFAGYNKAEVNVQELAAGPPTGSPIEVRLYGPNLDDLADLSEKVRGFFAQKPEVVNLTDSLEESTGEFNFVIDKDKANFYGFDVGSLAQNLRTAVYGTTADSVNIDDEEVEVVVKYAEGSFQSVRDLQDIVLIAPGGRQVKLTEIASVEIKPSLLAINHRDGDRVVTVTGDLEEGANLQEILSDFDAYQNDLAVPRGVDISVGGEIEDVEQSYREMFLSMIVAVLLISFILVLQFNSFKQPFIILFTLPLAIIGVIIGLNLFAMPFSITAFIGIVSLSGIVVNDAIVLIDRINRNIRSGMDYYEGIIEGGVARLQPIFLTTITTVAGILPLVWADELWRGLSITVIVGLIFSTALTLVMVPVLYAGLCRKDCLKQKD